MTWLTAEDGEDGEGAGVSFDLPKVVDSVLFGQRPCMSDGDSWVGDARDCMLPASLTVRLPILRDIVRADAVRV